MKRVGIAVIALAAVIAWWLGAFSPSPPAPVVESAPGPTRAERASASAPAAAPAPPPSAPIPARPAPPATSPAEAPDGASGKEPLEDVGALMASGKYDAAESLLDDILRKEPDNAGALVGLGALYADVKNQPAKAIPLLRRAIEKNPENAEALDKLLLSTTRSGNVAESAKTLRDLHSLYPDSASLNGEMGRMNASRGNYGEAVGYFERAVRKGASVDTRLDYASALLATRQAELARPVLEEVLKEDPSNEAARSMLAQAAPR